MINTDSQITFYYTDKFAETCDFYQNILGLELVLDQGCCQIFRVTASSFLGFCQSTAPVQTDSTIFTFVTADVDKCYRELKAQGVNFIKPPQLNEKFQIYHTFLLDPNGYKLEIQKFLDPNWAKKN
jgi:catechol 2,3-dioxygenase-like lactoylglutathione lyase family enzyme